MGHAQEMGHRSKRLPVPTANPKKCLLLPRAACFSVFVFPAPPTELWALVRDLAVFPVAGHQAVSSSARSGKVHAPSQRRALAESWARAPSRRGPFIRRRPRSTAVRDPPPSSSTAAPPSPPRAALYSPRRWRGPAPAGAACACPRFGSRTRRSRATSAQRPKATAGALRPCSLLSRSAWRRK